MRRIGGIHTHIQRLNEGVEKIGRQDSIYLEHKEKIFYSASDTKKNSNCSISQVESKRPSSEYRYVVYYYETSYIIYTPKNDYS